MHAMRMRRVRSSVEQIYDRRIERSNYMSITMEEMSGRIWE